MGWSIHFKFDKPILESDVQSCIDELPSDYSSWAIKNNWGWTCVVDVQIPKENDWYISGAYYSYSWGMPFAKLMKEKLEARGYKITIGEQD